VAVEGDRRLDLSRFFAKDDGQKLVKWSRREPNRGELVIPEEASAIDGDAEPVGDDFGEDLLAVVEEAVGDEPDPEERVELILDWMDEFVVREYREGLADAGSVLADRRGDATELTRVFVAMARAAGLPARERLGFVAQRTAFYLHPWAEVWIDGWISVDPYLGQFPADATHIRLTARGEDALASWDPGDVPGLDRLELRVVLPDEEAAESEG
jgi:transglutaminase-like putative cysteine protease